MRGVGSLRAFRDPVERERLAGRPKRSEIIVRYESTWYYMTVWQSMKHLLRAYHTIILAWLLNELEDGVV